MNGLFDSARSVIKDRYALLTPSGFVATALPGWEKAQCQVVISPAMGARFAQVLVTLQADGQCQGNTGANQYFIYVIEGPASILLDDRRHRLEAGSFIYLPPGKDVQLNSGGPATRLLMYQKDYQPLPGVDRPRSFVSHERETKAQPLAGVEGARVQALLPDQPAFDMAIQLFTFQPGATLPAIATPVMEHGLLMLRGQGLYRLNLDWHPVQAGDALWLAPYCPQWFVAFGKVPACFIAYHDAHREPI